MKKQGLFSMFIVLAFTIVIFLGGCVQEEDVCSKPSIKAERGCCLDLNENSICDMEEEEEPATETAECVPDWECTSWSECTTSGRQERICTDLNSCGTESPATSRTCTYVEEICEERWQCTKWGDCIDGYQKRSCTDLNVCGTYNNRPDRSRRCTSVEACSENWNCTEWDVCTGEHQTRTCTDLNSCGTFANKPAEEQTCELSVIDCGASTLSAETAGTDYNFVCFIEASENCLPAKLMHTTILDFVGLGFLTTTLTRMELKGMESDRCVYYQKIESHSVEFTDEKVQQLLISGLSMEEIEEQEQTANDVAQEAVGMEKTCSFIREDLTALLIRWGMGDLTSEDFDAAECVDSFSSDLVLSSEYFSAVNTESLIHIPYTKNF